MKWACVSVAFLALCSIGSVQATAQVTAADSAAVLVRTAQRFEAQGDFEVARALYRYVVEHFTQTPAGSSAAERLSAVRSMGTRGSGNTELQVWSTLFGLYLGVAVPGALGADQSEPYGIGLMLGGPTGFFGGRALARSRDLTEGQARAITMGGTWGVWQSLGWRKVFDWGVETYCDVGPFPGEQCYSTEDEFEEDLAATIVGGLAGMAVGYALSGRPISPGVATTVNLGALWGTWFGVAVGQLMDLENGDLLAATLVGGDAGLVATALLAPGWNVSRNRARTISIAGVIGGLGGAGIDLLTEPSNDKGEIAIPLVASLVGLGIGILSTRGQDADAEAGGRRGAALQGPLLNLAEGRLGLATPIPYPGMLERKGKAGLEPTPGVGITLFSATFR